MNARTKRAVIDASIERRMGITQEKGAEYSGAGSRFEDDDVDTLANFKRNGEKLGQHPVVVLAVYMNKHVDSYDTFIRQFSAAETLDDRRTAALTGEGIISRLDDLRNYIDLLECLLVDEGIITGQHQDFLPGGIIEYTPGELCTCRRDVNGHPATMECFFPQTDGGW